MLKYDSDAIIVFNHVHKQTDRITLPKKEGTSVKADKNCESRENGSTNKVAFVKTG